MNFYELFQIPISLQINLQELKNRYLQLSKQYHPDKYTNALIVEQQFALKHMELANLAYEELKNEDKRLPYFLKLKEVLVDKENYKLPNDFLMEMMELNESIIEAKMEQNSHKLQVLATEITAIKSQLNAQVAPYYLATANEEAIDLHKLKDYYFKIKYLKRLDDAINNKGVEI